jgi:hypothetical protein
MAEFPMPSTQEWGPKYWYIMFMGIKILEREEHERGAVPRSSSENVKTFYESLVHMFPCQECKAHYEQLIIDSPPRTGSSAELKEWLQFVGREVKNNQERMEKAKDEKAKEEKAKEEERAVPEKISIPEKGHSPKKQEKPIEPAPLPETIRIPITVPIVEPEHVPESDDLHSTLSKPANKKGAVIFTKGQTRSSNHNKYIIKNISTNSGIRRHSVLVNGIVQALVTSNSTRK